MKHISTTFILQLKKSIFVMLCIFTALYSFSQAKDSKGADFWLTFPGNLATNAEPSLFISGEQSTSGTVTIAGLGFAQNFTVTPGSITTISLPVGVFLNTSSGILDNGIHVTAQNEITIYGLNREVATTDAYLALPTDVLGTEYINLGYMNVNVVNATQFGIVATENGTTVTITPTATTDGHTAGVPYNVSLNQGQTYLLRNTAPYPSDLTGSVITSDHPIAVFGGHQCANIPNGYFYCDHIVEELPPTSAWGKNFVTIPLKTRLNGDTYRFLASTDNTTINVNGVSVATLNRGQYHEMILTASAQITSTEPILVAQYSNSSTYDNVTSDPFMMLIPPYEQFLGGYTISTPASGFTGNYINIAAPNAAVGTIKVDGVTIPAASFTAIGSSSFSGVQVDISLGVHNITGSGLPFGAFVYGFGPYDSYGYPGGQSFAPIAVVTSLDLTPETGTALINTEQCFDALVKDQNSNPLEGVRVDFTITGVNSASSGFAFTDANGIAHFCYTGANEGTDNITASVGTINDAATFTWINTCYVTVSAKKFYDLNADGLDNDGIAVQGWSITLSGTDENSNVVGPTTQTTDVNGTTDFTSVAKGTYTVAEGTQGNWINTTSKSASLGITDCTNPAQVKFGNVCIGSGTSIAGLYGIGFWTNKNGLSMITGSYLCELNSLCLRNANGSNFDPVAGCPAPTNSQINAAKTNLKNWLVNATATNMSYMLSAQLTAMKLNVLKGIVDGAKLIYAPGTLSSNAAGFATVNAIMTEANDILCANGIIDATSSIRSKAEAVKNALENANNNRNFVQSQPCSLTQPTVTTSARHQEVNIAAEELNVKVQPNPSNTYFSLIAQTTSKQSFSLRIFDAVGRLIETKSKLAAGQTFKVGENYKPGIYLVEVIQGNERKTLKLIKQAN
jgi:hypothetical protein